MSCSHVIPRLSEQLCPFCPLLGQHLFLLDMLLVSKSIRCKKQGPHRQDRGTDSKVLDHKKLGCNDSAWTVVFAILLTIKLTHVHLDGSFLAAENIAHCQMAICELWPRPLCFDCIDVPISVKLFSRPESRSLSCRLIIMLRRLSIVLQATRQLCAQVTNWTCSVSYSIFIKISAGPKARS
jgi:hypothetical protein